MLHLFRFRDREIIKATHYVKVICGKASYQVSRGHGRRWKTFTCVRSGRGLSAQLDSVHQMKLKATTTESLKLQSWDLLFLWSQSLREEVVSRAFFSNKQSIKVVESLLYGYCKRLHYCKVSFQTSETLFFSNGFQTTSECWAVAYRLLYIILEGSPTT